MCNPADRDDVDTVANPPTRSATPITVPSSVNVTLPSGVPAVDVTLAVKVTNWLTGAGLGDADSVVVVALRFTTCVRTAD